MNSGLGNYTSTIANKVFADNPNFNLNFNQVATLADIDDGATDCTGSATKLGYFTADVNLNGNILPYASREYIAATIIHETLHAYWTFSGKLGTFNQHTDMANNYIITMSKDLQALYSGITDEDAQALCWCGLQETQAWKDMVLNDPDKANSIKNINSQYRNGTGTKGSRCN